MSCRTLQLLNGGGQRPSDASVIGGVALSGAEILIEGFLRQEKVRGYVRTPLGPVLQATSDDIPQLLALEVHLSVVAAPKLDVLVLDGILRVRAHVDIGIPRELRTFCAFCSQEVLPVPLVLVLLQGLVAEGRAQTEFDTLLAVAGKFSGDNSGVVPRRTGRSGS